LCIVPAVLLSRHRTARDRFRYRRACVFMLSPSGGSPARISDAVVNNCDTPRTERTVGVIGSTPDVQRQQDILDNVLNFVRSAL
jgi:hypothetical protein